MIDAQLEDAGGFCKGVIYVKEAVRDKERIRQEVESGWKGDADACMCASSLPQPIFLCFILDHNKKRPITALRSPEKHCPL